MSVYKVKPFLGDGGGSGGEGVKVVDELPTTGKDGDLVLVRTDVTPSEKEYDVYLSVNTMVPFVIADTIEDLDNINTYIKEKLGENDCRPMFASMPKEFFENMYTIVESEADFIGIGINSNTATYLGKVKLSDLLWFSDASYNESIDDWDVNYTVILPSNLQIGSTMKWAIEGTDFKELVEYSRQITTEGGIVTEIKPWVEIVRIPVVKTLEPNTFEDIKEDPMWSRWVEFYNPAFAITGSFEGDFDPDLDHAELNTYIGTSGELFVVIPDRFIAENNTNKVITDWYINKLNIPMGLQKRFRPGEIIFVKQSDWDRNSNYSHVVVDYTDNLIGKETLEDPETYYIRNGKIRLDELNIAEIFLSREDSDFTNIIVDYLNGDLVVVKGVIENNKLKSYSREIVYEDNHITGFTEWTLENERDIPLTLEPDTVIDLADEEHIQQSADWNEEYGARNWLVLGSMIPASPIEPTYEYKLYIYEGEYKEVSVEAEPSPSPTPTPSGDFDICSASNFFGFSAKNSAHLFDYNNNSHYRFLHTDKLIQALKNNGIDESYNFNANPKGDSGSVYRFNISVSYNNFTININLYSSASGYDPYFSGNFGGNYYYSASNLINTTDDNIISFLERNKDAIDEQLAEINTSVNGSSIMDFITSFGTNSTSVFSCDYSKPSESSYDYREHNIRFFSLKDILSLLEKVD